MPAAPAAAQMQPPHTPGLAFAALAFLVLALQFGPMVGLIGFRLSGDDDWAWNGIVRDFAVIALMAFALVAWPAQARLRALPASARWALLIVVVYSLLALLTASGLLLTALNLRRLVLVPLLFVALLIIPWTPRQIDQLFVLVVASCAVVAGFGLVERMAPETLWTDVLDIEAYTAANNFDRFGHLPYAESGRFFSTDLEAWTGAPMRRVISTYLEPTTLAAGMAVLLVLALARQARGHRAVTLIVLALACGLATLSKGYAIFLAVLVAWRVLGVFSPRHLLWLALLAGALAIAASRFHLDGPLEHVAGLATALEYLAQGRWFGEGIGAAGNFSDAGAEIGEESGLGNVIAQVGVAALLSLLWVRALARDVLATGAARRDPGAPWIAAWLLFWMVTYLFSASSLGVGGNALGFTVLALYLHPSSGAR